MSTIAVAPELTAHVERFLSELESSLPGLVERVHLTGSGIGDDWRDWTSDIDLVFVVTRAPASADLDVIELLHAATTDGHVVDGLYVTDAQLRSGPDRLASAPQVIDAVLHRDASLDQNWVTWLEIERGVQARFSAGHALEWTPSGIRFRDTARHAASYCRRNLHDYWAKLAEETRENLSFRHDDDFVGRDALVWLALGPPRLVATIETGRVISKTDAASFAAHRWIEHARILSRAADVRAGADDVFTKRDALEVLDLVHKCVVAGTRG